MAAALTAALLMEQLQSDDVPGRADVQRKIEAELVSRTGLDISVDDVPDVRHFGQVDDWYATFEWSEGGIVHVHMAFWVVGAPRIDKVDVPCGQKGGSDGIEIHVPLPGQHAVPQAEAADRLSAFWDRAYTEYNVAKPCPRSWPRQALPAATAGPARNPEVTWQAPSACVRDLGPGANSRSDLLRASRTRHTPTVCWAHWMPAALMGTAAGQSWSIYWKGAPGRRVVFCTRSSSSQALPARRCGKRERDFASSQRWRSG